MVVSVGSMRVPDAGLADHQFRWNAFSRTAI
jgi:hypothetical protein